MIVVTSDNINVNSDGVHVILDDGSEIVFASDKTQVKYNIDYSYNAKETQSIKIIVSDNTPKKQVKCLGVLDILAIAFILFCGITNILYNISA